MLTSPDVPEFMVGSGHVLMLGTLQIFVADCAPRGKRCIVPRVVFALSHVARWNLFAASTAHSLAWNRIGVHVKKETEDGGHNIYYSIACYTYAMASHHSTSKCVKAYSKSTMLGTYSACMLISLIQYRQSRCHTSILYWHRP